MPQDNGNKTTTQTTEEIQVTTTTQGKYNVVPLPSQFWSPFHPVYVYRSVTVNQVVRGDFLFFFCGAFMCVYMLTHCIVFMHLRVVHM